MRNLKRQLIFGACITLCVGFTWCALSDRPRLSRDNAVRIAEAKLSQDMPGSSSGYHRIAVSYLPDERIWVVSYRVNESGSRCVVHVHDRSGQSQIWLP
jgi:hypothetical protein